MELRQKFDKVTSYLTNECKRCIRTNLVALGNAGQLKTPPHELDRMVTIINASIEQAHAEVNPYVQNIVQDADVGAAAVGLPNELFDAIVDVVGLMSPSSVKRKFAAFTIVRDEPFFLPVWCDYYARNFGEENLYVLDNSTRDGSIDVVKERWPRINVKQVPSTDAMLFSWTTDVVKLFQRALLRSHEVVVFADSDEFLIPSRRYTGLRAYCEEFLASEREFVRATGYGIVHQVDSEPPFEQGDLLAYRGSMFRTRGYDKTLLSKVPLDWAKGIHTVYDHDHNKRNDPPDHDLTLCHIRDFDMNVFHKRCVDRAKLGALHHGSTDIEKVRAYLKTRLMTWLTIKEPSEYTGNRVPIPECWRGLLVAT